jgi:sugar fermentation stimulation protein A
MKSIPSSDSVRLFSADADARFLARPNRFTVEAELREKGAGNKVAVHCANPGRLKELLYPGAELILERAKGGTKRKTNWSLAAVRFQGKIIPLISARANLAVRSLCLPRLFPNALSIEAEKTLPQQPSSRFDFLVETDQALYPIEVKACTLLKPFKQASFPDAPTQRGRRHVEELTALAACREGTGKEYRPKVIIAVFHADAETFSPNAETDPDFAKVLCRARNLIDIRIPLFETDEEGLVRVVRETIPFVLAPNHSL